MSETMKIRTVGLTEGRDPLLFEPGVCLCGDIGDGVSFNLPDPERPGQWRGCWVIAFADLERMYLAAKQARE